MSTFKVVFTKASKKEFEKLPYEIKKRIYKAVSKLTLQPFPSGYKKLNNFQIDGIQYDELYRVRIGDYRMIYAVESEIVTITILRTKHRSKVYKQ